MNNEKMFYPTNSFSKKKDVLTVKMKNNDDKIENVQNNFNIDLTLLRMEKLLTDNNFGFNYFVLRSIHKYIFKDIYNFAGDYRIHNIVKKEDVLKGNSIKYVNFRDIESSLDYEINKEKNFDYSNLNQNEIVKHIANFSANIWQIHPFENGNTKAFYVFIIKYLEKQGFSIDSSLFKEYFLYFRNSLIIANYCNIPKNIYPNNTYLIMFFENLLYGKNNLLDNNNFHINFLEHGGIVND